MMRWIIGWSLKFRLFVIALAVETMLVGITQLRNMPVDVLPEFAPPYVEVQTEALGLSAPEVEELVTLNLEELLNGTPWLQTMRSTSVPGLSSITLIFQPGTDIIRARQLISERLSLAYALPNVAQPPVILPPLSATSRAMIVGLSSQQVSAIEMSVLARWTIRPALLSVPGVANVAIWGMRDRQLQVQVDPAKLQANHVTLDQIVSTTGNALWVSPLTFLNASTPGSGGWIDGPQQRIEVRHVLPIASPKDLAQVNVEGTKLTLGDVAAVVEDHQPLIGDDILNNSPGLLLVIEKFPGANPQEVTRGVEAKLAELRPGLSGIQIDTNIFRPANFIDMATGNLTWSLLIGFLLVVLVLLAFFYHWRIALISMVVIPLSLVVAGFVLYLRGSTMNVMVLAGLLIAVTIVVDDVILDVENIMRRLRQHHQEGSDRSTASIILEASLEMRSAMIFATLIILLALLPIFLLGCLRHILPAPGHLLCAGFTGLDGGGPDRHTSTVPAPVAQCPARAARIAPLALVAAWLRGVARAAHSRAAPGVPRHRCPHYWCSRVGRPRGVALSWKNVNAPFVQGAKRHDPVASPTRNVLSRNGPHHDAGQS
jgi:Cu/Ag efflux pump CusA